MPVQITQDGKWIQEYVGPYVGPQSNKPDVLLDDNAAADMINFMLRNDEIRSRPPFLKHSTVVDGLGVPSLVGVESFKDINGKYHTVTWSGSHAYQYDPSLLPAPPWADLGPAAVTNIGQNPLSYRVFANTLYYTGIQSLGGGIKPFVALWDGLTANPQITQVQYDASVTDSIAGIALASSPTVGGSLPGGPAIVGPISIGGRYLGELNNHLILANVSIMDQGAGAAVFNFPNTLWWSANGLPLEWDPTQNISAGFNSLLDVGDEITGLVTLGIAGFVFRTYGITQFAPSGSALNPFTFDHMWSSDRGIGCVFPWSIAQYGPTAAFVADDNIYSLSVTNAQPIGGISRDAIFTDLANSTQNVVANIVPRFRKDYVYLTYQLCITLSDRIRLWVYSFEDKNWSPWDIPLGSDLLSLSAAPNSV